jgi:hypothetical protein
LVAQKTPLFRDVDVLEPRERDTMQVDDMVLQGGDGEERDEGCIYAYNAG